MHRLWVLVIAWLTSSCAAGAEPSSSDTAIFQAKKAAFEASHLVVGTNANDVANRLASEGFKCAVPFFHPPRLAASGTAAMPPHAGTYVLECAKPVRDRELPCDVEHVVFGVAWSRPPSTDDELERQIAISPVTSVEYGCLIKTSGVTGRSR